MGCGPERKFANIQNAKNFDAAYEAEFARLLTAKYPDIRRKSRAMTRGSQSADDLAQETLLRAWAGRRTYDWDRPIEQWLFAIMRNAFLGDVRRNSREDQVDNDYDLSVGVECERQSAYMELIDVAEAIDLLADDFKQTLLLVGVDGLSNTEAAHHCSCPEGTIKSRLSRARTELKRIIGE